MSAFARSEQQTTVCFGSGVGYSKSMFQLIELNISKVDLSTKKSTYTGDIYDHNRESIVFR